MTVICVRKILTLMKNNKPKLNLSLYTPNYVGTCSEFVVFNSERYNQK